MRSPAKPAGVASNGFSQDELFALRRLSDDCPFRFSRDSRTSAAPICHRRA
jgi:hypothetical protein